MISITAARRAALALALMGGLSGAALAEDEGALAQFNSLKPDVALDLARGALEACREAGYQVAVAVVDRFGQTQVVLRDRFAGPHTVPTASGKAWTAVSFRGATLELDRRLAEGELSPGLRRIPGALFLGGGLPVEAAGSIVGGIGISGAPDPQFDEDCANAGLEAISDLLDF